VRTVQVSALEVSAARLEAATVQRDALLQHLTTLRARAAEVGAPHCGFVQLARLHARAPRVVRRMRCSAVASWQEGCAAAAGAGGGAGGVAAMRV